MSGCYPALYIDATPDGWSRVASDRAMCAHVLAGLLDKCKVEEFRATRTHLIVVIRPPRRERIDITDVAEQYRKVAGAFAAEALAMLSTARRGE